MFLPVDHCWVTPENQLASWLFAALLFYRRIGVPKWACFQVGRRRSVLCIIQPERNLHAAFSNSAEIIDSAAADQPVELEAQPAYLRRRLTSTQSTEALENGISPG